MAIAEAQVYMPQAPRPKYRPLEDERWLAFFLMAPTLILLALFIAYPFVKGIELSVTNSRVGVPGEFVGIANFVQDLERQHLPHRGLQHRALYGGDDRLQARRSACGSRCC